MTTPRLVILCGVSFAGKTTAARALSGLISADVVSLDSINAERGLHGGDGERWPSPAAPAPRWSGCRSTRSSNAGACSQTGRPVPAAM